MLVGKKVVITAGPTIERIDPVRYISNYSSGKQAYAIAEIFIKSGADVTLISGPVNIDPPKNCNIINVQNAQEMLAKIEDNLPFNIGIFVAAVCDWRVKEISAEKIKKQDGQDEMNLTLVKNPDILKIISNCKERPQVMVGFAAETENLILNAKKKLKNKNCDIIIANNVANNVFNNDKNKISIISKDNIEEFDLMDKLEVANIILEKVKKLIY